MAKESKSGASASEDGGKSVISKTEPDTIAPTAPVAASSDAFDKKSKPKRSGKSNSSSKNKSKSVDTDRKKSKKSESTKSASKKSSKNQSKKGEFKPKGAKSKSNSSRAKSKSKSRKYSKKSINNRSKDKHEKHRSKDKAKSKTKSGDGHKPRRDASSEDGYKLKSKPKSKENHRPKSTHSSSAHRASDTIESVMASTQDTMTSKEKKEVGVKVRKIEATQGAIAVTNEKAITSSGYLVEGPKLFESDYSTVLHAKKTGTKSSLDRLVVKVVNLAECSPRSRVNLLMNSVRIMRFVSGSGDKSKGPMASVFVAVYDVFLVSGVRLCIFMAECDSNRSLYDLVKSKQSLPATDIRTWCKSIVVGVHELQQIGVAHRAIKLQHILFDSVGNAKLVGWGKSVFFYDPYKKRIQLQRKERRVRRNCHLPPEAFMGSYNPSHADIWSVGVALVAMCTKRYPFNVRDKNTKFSSQWREFVKNHELNTYVRNLCHKMFIISPKRRISSKNLLNDKYFSVAEKELMLLSCKADPNEVREDSRVGGMSTIDLVIPTGRSIKDKLKEGLSKKSKKPSVKPTGNEDKVDWAEEQMADQSGVNENATGNEGGNVGEEETLPDTEQKAESQLAENSAPEEAEAEAQPEDGEFAEADEDIQQTGADG